MTLVGLIAWRPLLAVAITVTFIAAGPEAPGVGHDGSVGDVNLDRPTRPRPPQRCRGPPPAAPSRAEPQRPDGHAPRRSAGHAPSPRPIPPAHDAAPDHHRPAVRPRLHHSPPPTY